MAYQQVGTPRFYVNVLEWGALNGALEIDDLFRTLPVNPQIVSEEISVALAGSFPQMDGMLINPAIFILGHKSASEDSVLNMHGVQYTDDFNVNYSTSAPAYDGWSLVSLIHTDTSNLKFKFTAPIVGHWATDDPPKESTVSSIILSNYHDAPHSPDLNLSLSYEYGTKEITTRGGASLSNSFYSKPPMWGDLGAWELGDGSENQNLSRSGRRVWDLSFSYLSQEDTFPKYNQLTTLETDDVADQSPEQYTLQGSDDFYSQVIHKTNGGQLPFIFQPNKDDNTNFAIAKIDSGFTFKQVANGVYNVKMKIREVW